jgi:Ca-activated chloride channel family protein
LSDAVHFRDLRRPACRSALFAFFVFALQPLAPSQEPVAAPAEPIRVSVDRVNMGVIVTDPQGNFIGGLGREDFHIFDDDVEQPITDFASITEPAQVLLLVEAGPAVYFLEASHVRAAHALLEGLSPGDRVAVVKYDAAPHGMLDFTPDKQAVDAALANVRYYVGFGALDLSRSLSTVLDWLAKVQGKKSIVLLSTGFDTSPPEIASALMTRVKTSDVRILALSLSGELRQRAPNQKDSKTRKNKDHVSPEKSAIAAQGFAEADQLLTALTQATGGRVFFPNSAQDFAAVYAQIAQLVRHEYSLAFVPPAHDGKPHTIDVRITPPTMPDAPAPTYRIDHRSAYLAPTP